MGSAGGSPSVSLRWKMPIAQAQEKVFWQESLQRLLSPGGWLMWPAGVV